MAKSSLLSEPEIRQRLSGELRHWSYDGKALHRRYATGGFKSTLLVASTIGHLAEAAWHHPELLCTYGAVEVSLSTHDAGGVTEKDLALAAMVEKVVGWRPGTDGGPLGGTPDDPRYRHVRYEKD
jgi:4a-hydroxytetrahydrobiopterin dehydratase